MDDRAAVTPSWLCDLFVRPLTHKSITVTIKSYAAFFSNPAWSRQVNRKIEVKVGILFLPLLVTRIGVANRIGPDRCTRRPLGDTGSRRTARPERAGLTSPEGPRSSLTHSIYWRKRN